MELQNIFKTKKTNFYNLYRTLGDDKKVDYGLLNNSLSDIRYDIEIFENFLSPRKKLAKQLFQRKLKNNTLLVKSKRNARNSIFINLSNKNLNLRNHSSSNSLDKLIQKHKFSFKSKENKKLNSIKNIKANQHTKSRNDNIKNLNKNKKGIFITDYKIDESNKNNIEYNNPINNILQPKQKNLQGKFYSFSLNKNLPSIKTQTINSKNKYLNTFTEPMIIKKNKFLFVDEKAVSNMIKKNRSIVNKITYSNNKFENDMVSFETMYKYLNWKYGISDSNKYFIDIGAYKKNPENLIDNKKSFYDKLDEMVDEINKNKKMKDMESIKKQYGININRKKDNVDYNSIYVNEYDRLFLKGRKIKNILKELYARKKTEKRTRRKIKILLDRSRDKIININKNFDNFRIKDLKMNGLY